MICRISTENQDADSLKDQEDFLREVIDEEYSGPVEFKTIATRGSGENLQRAELDEIEALVLSGQFDLVLMEDLARYMRDVKSKQFCGLCVDHDTRVIAIYDFVDTANENWPEDVIRAASRHEQYNEQTSRRIKRSQRARFLREGGVVQQVIFGYTKPEGCRTDKDLIKTPGAETWVMKSIEMLKNGASFQEVADMLNENGIDVGSAMRLDHWDGDAVGRWIKNPMLSGRRRRNVHETVKHFTSGKRKSKKAAPGRMLERELPHLAYMTVQEQEELLAKLDKQNVHYGRKKDANGNDPLSGRPKQRTLWPGQQCYCSICGRMLVYGAHGKNANLICSGANQYLCWNGISFDAVKYGPKLQRAILNEINQIPGWSEEVRNAFRASIEDRERASGDRVATMRGQLSGLDRKLANLVEAIGSGSATPMVLVDECGRLEQAKKDLELQIANAERLAAPAIELPDDNSIRTMVDAAVSSTPIAAQEFNRLMKKLIDRIYVIPVRSIRGEDHPRLKARFQLNLINFLPTGISREGIPSLVSKWIEVDLFQRPQREANLQRFIELRKQHPTSTLKKLAEMLQITDTATQRIAQLAAKLAEAGLDDPYVVLKEPPPNYDKLSRHKHQRYRFDPLEGHPLP